MMSYENITQVSKSLEWWQNITHEKENTRQYNTMSVVST